MSFPASLLLLSLILFQSAKGTTTYETVFPGSRSKAVETYEINSQDYEADPVTAKRYLTYLELYNDRGKVVESWDLTEDSAGPFYRRRVFTYDRFGRKTAELVYESSHAAPKQYFSVSRSAIGVKIIPELADNLSTVTISEYDVVGRLVEERTSDANGAVTERRVREYDNVGNLKRFALLKPDGKIEHESLSTYSQNGRQVRTIGKDSAGAITSAGTRRVDDKGRELFEEVFVPGPKTPDSKADTPFVLSSRAISSYLGDITNFEWFICNDQGDPQTRLLIIDKGDYEISRKTYSPAFLSADSPGKSSQVRWVLVKEGVCDYVYNKSGELIKETLRIRVSPDIAFHYTYVREKVITHF